MKNLIMSLRTSDNKKILNELSFNLFFQQIILLVEPLDSFNILNSYVYHVLTNGKIICFKLLQIFHFLSFNFSIDVLVAFLNFEFPLKIILPIVFFFQHFLINLF